MALLKTSAPALDEARVRSLRDEINVFIDGRVAEIRKTCEGVPETVLRNILMNRSDGCLCVAFLNIKQSDLEEAERSKQ